MMIREEANIYFLLPETQQRGNPYKDEDGHHPAASSQTLDNGKYKYWAAEKWKITRYMFNQHKKWKNTMCV